MVLFCCLTSSQCKNFLFSENNHCVQSVSEDSLPLTHRNDAPVAQQVPAQQAHREPDETEGGRVTHRADERSAASTANSEGYYYYSTL